MTSDSPGITCAPSATQINVPIWSVLPPVYRSALETTSREEVSLPSLLPLADLVYSWAGVCVVLGDLPVDSFRTGAAFFGWLFLGLSKAGSLEAEIVTLRASPSVSEAHSRAWPDAVLRLVEISNSSYQDAASG